MAYFYSILTQEIVINEQLYLSLWHHEGKYWDSDTRDRDMPMGVIRMIYVYGTNTGRHGTEGYKQLLSPLLIQNSTSFKKIVYYTMLTGSQWN